MLMGPSPKMKFERAPRAQPWAGITHEAETRCHERVRMGRVRFEGISRCGSRKISSVRRIPGTAHW